MHEVLGSGGAGEEFDTFTRQALDQLSSGAIEAELGLDDDEETVEPAEAQLGQMSKTRQKLEFKKNREID